jgi:hypothetical protein
VAGAALISSGTSFIENIEDWAAVSGLLLAEQPANDKGENTSSMIKPKKV